MNNKMKLLLAYIALSLSMPLMASDGLSAGYIKDLSYRGGWTTFKVIDGSGVNRCEPCPVDPGSLGTKRCWVKENKAAQLSMMLSAQARNKKIHGRVYSLTSNCEVYQMTIDD